MCMVCYYAVYYVYCEHHYDDYVRGCYEYFHNYALLYIYHDYFDEYLGRL